MKITKHSFFTLLVAFILGLLFALGLALAGMTQPQKVIAFLNITGSWDPSLAFVMGAGVMITLPIFWYTRSQARPWHAKQFRMPTATAISPKLVLGSMLFGIGWGIAGFCPGPAIVSAATLSTEALLFTASMSLGFWIHAKVLPLFFKSMHPQPQTQSTISR